MQKSAIYKYKLDWVPEQSIDLDDNDFEFLCLLIQNGCPTVWIKHDDREAVKKPKTIVILPTGPFDRLPYENLGKYLGTLVRESGTVWHFFFKY